MLQGKIKEQEARSRQLEQELAEMARKHADAEAQWRKGISTANAGSLGVDRNERLDKQDEQDKLYTWKYDKERLDMRGDQDKLSTSKYDKERLDGKDDQGRLNAAKYDGERLERRADQDKLRSSKYEKERLDRRDDHDKLSTSKYEKERRDRRDDQDKLYYEKEGKRRHDTSNKFSHFDEASHGEKSRGLESYHDEIEGKHRRNRRHVSYTDADEEESWRDERTESSRREGRGSRKTHEGDAEGHLRDDRAESPTGGRKVHKKSERKSQRSRERSVENVVTKTHAAVTEVQVVRDDEVYRLSKGRIELLESEKSALMELNTSLQEENKALKQLALSLQKGTGEIRKTLPMVS